MVDIIKAHATKNLCYIAAEKMVPKGIVVHSTGANNPNLKRYVDCVDEVGKNTYGNHWNNAKPGGRKVCVHAFIGYDKNKNVRVAEILPLNICCWGVGSGSKGSYNYNPAHIQFEICEDNLQDKTYYKKAFQVAAEYCAYLCQKYGLTVSQIVSHKEAYKKGYGSNHGDPEHWMKKYGEDMNDFRNEVSNLLSKESGQAVAKKEKVKDTAKTSVVAFSEGDLVSISSKATYYTGETIPDWVKSQNWYIIGTPKGDRVVLDKNEKGTHAICSPVNAKYLSLVKGKTEKSKTNVQQSKVPYMVRITANALNIRKGAGTNTAITGCIKDKGVYTIVEEKQGVGATLWGKLKSGVGWISLDYTKKIK